jgi:hypothetical protein
VAAVKLCPKDCAVQAELDLEVEHYHSPDFVFEQYRP